MIPTIESLPTSAREAAKEVFTFLSKSRTGFKDESALVQQVLVEIHLECVIAHPAAIKDEISVQVGVLEARDEARRKVHP